jgi:hypothetical protein
MPLNEARRFERSALTPQEQREQTAAIFGLTAHNGQQNALCASGIRLQTPDPFMDINNLSPEQIAMLRQVLAQHEGGITRQPKEFDLNNPPQERYVYQEYPRCVYHHESGKSKNVHTPHELKAAIEDGWSKDSQPKPAVVPEIETEAAESEEIARLDALAKQPRKNK